ncbi:MAG: hypothetical protein PUG91_01900 [Clostridiales bacterium]|nr:hypothetical protein [Clostridiales bacterium]
MRFSQRGSSFTIPCSTLTLVDRQMTLYARFIDPADCVTVTLQHHGRHGACAAGLCRSEYLLNKPVDQIYTSKDGNTFCGWCLDEACEESFGYTDPIRRT